MRIAVFYETYRTYKTYIPSGAQQCAPARCGRPHGTVSLSISSAKNPFTVFEARLGYDMRMKIATKTGDLGQTSLFSGGRVPKNHPRLECYGSLDELSSFLGLLAAELSPETSPVVIESMQAALFALGGALADAEGHHKHPATQWDVSILEEAIETLEGDLPPIRSFVLPGGSREAALAHVARSVCRRAERQLVSLSGSGGNIPDGALPYLNRLSDFLFLLARKINADLGIRDLTWRSGS